MKFLDVITDVKKLVGLELSSIRPGANIIILNVSDEEKSLKLQTASGQIRNRPYSELERIWEQLMLKPAVHVEEVLHGSGSSRNQPETILANLPYIEWLKINGKKHLAYVGESTHAYGILKEMDPVKAMAVRTEMGSKLEETKFKALIVSKDIKKAVSQIENICEGNVKTLDTGAYQFATSRESILFIAAETCELSEGTYCIMSSQKDSEFLKKVCICGENYSVFTQDNMKILIEDK